MWSYRNIVSAIDQLCGGGAADTFEGDGFAAVVNPSHDGVLQYLMKRRFADCRYEKGSSLLIAASRDGHYEDSFVIGGRRYRRRHRALYRQRGRAFTSRAGGRQRSSP
jgi:hypothetical protein